MIRPDMAIAAAVAAVALAAPAAASYAPDSYAPATRTATEGSPLRGEPYGGCKEAYDYPWTQGWRWCVRNERIFVAIRPCVGEIGKARCVWDARHEGNGDGQSVVLVKNGVRSVGHRFAHVVAANWRTLNCGGE